MKTWKSYLGFQCAQWICGNGGHSEETPWVPEQKDALSYSTGATAETCAMCYKGGKSQTCPQGARMPCSCFRGCSPWGDPAWRNFPRTGTYCLILSLFWVTEPGSLILFSNRGRQIAFMPFKHQLISVTVLGESTRGRCSPFKHNAPTALSVALLGHWSGQSSEIFGKEV